MFSFFKRQKRVVKDFHAEIGEDVQTELAKLGSQHIPLQAITGSVGRAHELDSKFRSKLRGWTERHQRIQKAITQGSPMPPIKLFLLQGDKEEYYIFDGHHRVAAALKCGFDTINAEVTKVSIMA